MMPVRVWLQNFFSSALLAIYMDKGALKESSTIVGEAMGW